MLVIASMAALVGAKRVYVPTPFNVSYRPVISRRLQSVKKSSFEHTVCPIVCGVEATGAAVVIAAVVGGAETGAPNVGGGVLGGRVAANVGGGVLGGRVAACSLRNKLMVDFFSSVEVAAPAFTAATPARRAEHSNEE